MNGLENLNTGQDVGQSEAEKILGLMPSYEEHVSESIKPEAWTKFPDITEGVDERPDVNGVPQTLWRGERVYLDNIDELGKRSITTVGHEAKHNRDGVVFCARDKQFACAYAIGTDGVTWYSDELPKERIPIGVVYKIENTNNYLNASPTDDEPLSFGPFAGKFREFIVESVPAGQYSIVEIYIMDDFDQPGGHRRSDFRRPKEVYKIRNQEELPGVIAEVKRRMDELDQERHLSSE